MLSLREAAYHWRGRPLVRSATIDLRAGEVTVVVGPNGAGKSTMLRMMSGELTPTSGVALSQDEPLHTVAPWRLAQRRAVMTQEVEVAFPFTALEVTRLGIESLGRAMKPALRAEIVERCLAAADVAAFADRPYNRLSGGEKRRVQFARALAQLQAGRVYSKTQALLLDEPVANLDLKHQLQLLDEARRIAAEGVAVLAVLHDLNLAARYADILIVMSQGAVLADGPRDEILASPLLSEAFGVELSASLVVAAKDLLVLPAAWVAGR